MRSSVEMFSYDPQRESLDVLFQGGSIWSYHPVDFEQFERLSKCSTEILGKEIRNLGIVGVKKQ